MKHWVWWQQRAILVAVVLVELLGSRVMAQYHQAQTKTIGKRAKASNTIFDRASSVIQARRQAAPGA